MGTSFSRSSPALVDPSGRKVVEYMVNSYASKRVSVFEELGVWTVLVHNFSGENKTFEGEEAREQAIRYAGLHELGIYNSPIAYETNWTIVS